ncbi:ADP-ribose pyrophosphatase [Desulfuromusa kysingii]|uniref:GDP-mannose pyrophosphatase n=1 Tax=Desulfuromusa kysingii TaxID=37625 RepID=A0A1H3W6T3_9BACT|nr:NUDIX hydrolase [Desulfuromusa kysingii]SDZ82839.1 ADP-ribose pyrophosphatase [Desulfuromusa kysingii]
MSKITEEIIYQGRILDLVSEVHLMPNNSESRFEIIKHPGGAAALPILADGRLLLIRQYRPAVEDYVYEIPAGRLEIGETPSDCIARELEEEIGYRPKKLESLGYVYSSVGFCTEKIFIFIATELEQTQTALEPDEFIEPWIVTLDKALEMISAGTITDAKTQLALMRYALK